MKLGGLEALIGLRTYKDIFQTIEQAKNTFKTGNSMNRVCTDRLQIWTLPFYNVKKPLKP